MSNSTQHPKWWQAYTAVAALLGLFWPETHAQLTGTEHIVAELGILALIFGFLRAWLHANRSVLIESDPADAGWGARIYRNYPAARQDLESGDDQPIERPADAIAVAGPKFAWRERAWRESGTGIPGVQAGRTL
jgi:hypothetical protein